MQSSTPPRELLDPPDVDGLVAWVRRCRSASAQGGDPAAAAREQLAAVLADGRRTGRPQSVLGPEERWRLRLHPRYRSHRSGIGPFIVWCKRNLVRPFIRWHLEFTEDNARTQAYVNESLVLLVEHLAERVVALEQELARRGTPDADGHQQLSGDPQ